MSVARAAEARLTRSCAYYWGITGVLIGLTLYRPAYGAEALQGKLINSPAWIGFWTVFIVVSLAPFTTTRPPHERG